MITRNIRMVTKNTNIVTSYIKFSKQKYSVETFSLKEIHKKILVSSTERAKMNKVINSRIASRNYG